MNTKVSLQVDQVVIHEMLGYIWKWMKFVSVVREDVINVL